MEYPRALRWAVNIETLLPMWAVVEPFTLAAELRPPELEWEEPIMDH
jgi:hypothetical protein